MNEEAKRGKRGEKEGEFENEENQEVQGKEK